MTDRVAQLAAASKALSPEERVRLLDLLLESLHTDLDNLDAKWEAEIERRVTSHDNGEGELHDLDQVMSDATRLAP